jgi:hypothetical protein
VPAWHEPNPSCFVPGGKIRHGLITVSELIVQVIQALDVSEPGVVLRLLPDDYREAVRQYVQSGSVPSGAYYLSGVVPSESRARGANAREYNRRAVEVLRRYFDAGCGDSGRA